MTKRGTAWRARYRDEEGQEHETRHPSKKEAVAHLREQVAALTTGTWVDPSAGRVTFGAYAAEWLLTQHVRPTTARLLEQRVRLYLSPVIGELPLRSIRRSHVVEVVTRTAGQVTPLVTRYALTTLRAILDAAVADRLIARNVARDRTIKPPSREYAPVTPLTAEHVAQIAERMAGRYRAMVLLAAATGLRSGELRALTIDRISPPVHLSGDLSPQQVTVHVDRQVTAARAFGPTKTDRSVRDVVVGRTVVAELIAHIREHGLGDGGLLFSTPTGKMIASCHMSRAWAAATEGLELPPGATWHDLRHYYASEQLSNGVGVAAVAKHLGNTPQIVLSTYAHAMPSDEQRILDVSEGIARRLTS